MKTRTQNYILIVCMLIVLSSAFYLLERLDSYGQFALGMFGLAIYIGDIVSFSRGNKK